MTAHLADSSAFNQLRTQEQLGYVASAGYHRLYDVDGLTVLIQGPRLSPAGMDGRIEAWLEKFRGELDTMSEETFSTNVRSVIEMKTERDKQLAQETNRHWAEIVKRTYRFGRVKEEVAALKEVTLEDVREFFDRHLAATAPMRRKLSSRVVGGAARGQSEEQEVSESSQQVERLHSLEEVRAFKAELPTHSIG